MLSVRTWEWVQSSHPSLSKKANKRTSQNVKLFLWNVRAHGLLLLSTLFQFPSITLKFSKSMLCFWKGNKAMFVFYFQKLLRTMFDVKDVLSVIFTYPTTLQCFLWCVCVCAPHRSRTSWRSSLQRCFLSPCWGGGWAPISGSRCSSSWLESL